MRLTKVLLALLCGMLCIGIVSCGSTGGGGGAAKTSDGLGEGISGSFEFRPFDDQDDNGGSSTNEMTEASVSNGTAYRFTGAITNKYQYGFAGAQVVPTDDATLEAIRTCTAFSFKIKGDGQRYAVKMPTSDIKDYAYYERVFPTEDGQEIEVVVQIKQLMQPSWGSFKKFNQGVADFIEFQTTHNGKPGPFDFTIWDFKTYQ
jgi:hypothetical protein